MSDTRGDMTHGLLVAVHDLPDMPLHAPVLREDRQPHVHVGCTGDTCLQGRAECRSGCNVVPLKAERVRIDPPRRTTAADVVHRRDVQQAQHMLWLKSILMAMLWWVWAFLLAVFIGWLTAHEARAADSTETAALSAAADGVSTVVVVGSGAGYEAGLIAHPPMFAAVALAKVATPYIARDLPPEQRKPILQWWSGLFSGAATNNALVFAMAKLGCAAVGGLAALPLAAGAYVGYVMYHRTGAKFDAEQQPIIATDADAQLALAQDVSQ